MAVQIPHRIHTEISQEKVLRGNQARSWRNVPRVGATQGVLERRGAHYARPCAYVAECAPEVSGVQRGGLHQRQECNSHCTPLHEARKELRCAGILGARLFRRYSRTGYGDNPTIHRGTRKRGSKVRPDANAIDYKNRTTTRKTTELKKPALSGFNLQAPGFVWGL